MIYVSGDLETMTREKMAPKYIIGASFVVEDSDNPGVPVKSLPNLTFLIDQGQEISGEYGALAMNARYLQMIEDFRRGKSVPFPVLRPHKRLDGTVLDPNGWEVKVSMFLQRYVGARKAVLCGKNAGVFDYQFLPPAVQQAFIYRIIDVGSAMIDFTMPAPPSFQDLKNKYVPGMVAHDMYEDACDNILILRNHPTYTRPLA